MLNSMRKHGTTLAVFAAVTTGLTAVVYTLTKSTIAHQAALQQKALLDQVVPPENYDNVMQNECFLGQRSGAGQQRPAPLVSGAQKRTADRCRVGNHRAGRLFRRHQAAGRRRFQRHGARHPRD